MRLRTQIIVIALLRIIMNTMQRMVYPFLAVFARGLGVDVTAVSLALAGRNMAGVFGPIFHSSSGCLTKRSRRTSKTRWTG